MYKSLLRRKKFRIQELRVVKQMSSPKHARTRKTLSNKTRKTMKRVIEEWKWEGCNNDAGSTKARLIVNNGDRELKWRKEAYNTRQATSHKEHENTRMYNWITYCIDLRIHSHMVAEGAHHQTHPSHQSPFHNQFFFRTHQSTHRQLPPVSSALLPSVSTRTKRKY